MKQLGSRGSWSKYFGIERYVNPSEFVEVKVRKRSMQAVVVGPIASSSNKALIPTG